MLRGNTRLAGLTLAGLLAAAPAFAQLSSVVFKTNNKTVGFLWGTAVSGLLRSQAGVGEVVEPYPNLRKGQIKVKPSNDKPLDLPALVRLLESEAGFAPVTEVEIDLRGRVTKRGGRLSLEAGETGQAFEIGKKPKGQAPAEGQLIEVRGALEDVRSARRLRLLEWKAAPPSGSQP